MVVDFDGRILAQADPGPGEKIVVAPVDVGALRHERSVRSGHHMLAHLRTEAYPAYGSSVFPPHRLTTHGDIDIEASKRSIEEAKRQLP